MMDSNSRSRLKLVATLGSFVLASQCHGFICQGFKSGRIFVVASKMHLPEDSDAQSDETHRWTVPQEGLSGTVFEQRPKPHLTNPTNATLPIALMVLDPELYPTRSKAMRSIR